MLNCLYISISSNHERSETSSLKNCEMLDDLDGFIFSDCPRPKGRMTPNFLAFFGGWKPPASWFAPGIPHLLLPSRQPVLLGNQPHIVRDFAHV